MIREEITAGAFQADLEEWEIAFLLREMSAVHLLSNSLRNRHGGTLILAPGLHTLLCFTGRGDLDMTGSAQASWMHHHWVALSPRSPGISLPVL